MRTINKAKAFDLSMAAPPSKAHSLRAIIIASLADGKTTIKNVLLAQDQLNVINCLRSLGIEIDVADGVTGSNVTVYGCNGKISPPADTTIDVGESGVGKNFLTSLACLSDKPVTITGSARIQQRPIGELVSALGQLGCSIDFLENDGFLPILVHGGGIAGGSGSLRGSISSQYFSSLAISVPYAKSDTIINCTDDMTEKPYIDITLDMMRKFGATADNNNYNQITVKSGLRYQPQTLQIEGDYSSCSFFFLAAAICRSRISITGLNPATSQGDKGFLDLLEQMGCDVAIADDRITLLGKPLQAVTVNMSNIPDLLPPAAIAAAFAAGTSRFTHIGHLRHKECDRLAVTAELLNKMGIEAICDDTSLSIIGSKSGKTAHGGTIDPHNDHRQAMSFAVAGLVTGGQTIQNNDCVAKSFPDFWEKFEIFRK